MSESAAMIGAASSGRFIVRAALRTDVGKVRSENQDFGTFTSLEEENGRHPGGRLLIVADGMGGHRGGATASRLAAETVKTQYVGSETDDIPEALRAALNHANSRIFREAQANPDLRGMGTTTSALAIRGDQGWFAHVGDSRIYMVSGGEIKQLTDDHSLVASMVREGLLTSDEAATHPRRNVLQRSMGVSEDVEIDIRGPIELREGDTFILCSDGLHGVVKEDEMKQVALSMSIEQGAEELVRRALDRGAPDNVTVILARVERRSDDDVTIVDRPTEETSLFEDTLVDASGRTAEVLGPSVGMPGSQTATGPGNPAVSFTASFDGEDVFGISEPAASSPRTPTLPGNTALPPSSGSTVEMPESRTVEPPARKVAEPASARAVPTLQSRPVPRPVVRRKKSSVRSVFMWALLFVLVLGAAGGWLFWTQQQKVARPASSSSGR